MVIEIVINLLIVVGIVWLWAGFIRGFSIHIEKVKCYEQYQQQQDNRKQMNEEKRTDMVEDTANAVKAYTSAPFKLLEYVSRPKKPTFTHLIVRVLCGPIILLRELRKKE